MPRPCFVSLCILSLLLSACNFRDEKNPSSTDPNDLPPIDASFPLSYALIQEQVLDPYCTGCHSDAGGNLGATNLDSYAEVKNLLERVRIRTLVAKTMPPSGPMDLNSQALLNAWIQRGAPETAKP